MRDLLRCPHCHASLAPDGATWGCATGHRFDVARQGHVTPLVAPTPHAGDTAEMLDARDAVLGAGHLDAVTEALVDGASDAPPGCVVEVGAGTGHHLGRVVAALGRPGIAMDVSTPAVRRAARRAAEDTVVVRADAWSPWPVRDRVAAVVLAVFGPRNVAETARVLVPGGWFLAATPRPDHLTELIGPLGLLGVRPDKQERLVADVGTHLEVAGTTRVHDVRRVDRTTAVALATMGPSGHHRSVEELRTAAAGLPDALEVTVAVDVTRFRAP